ncbi:hypothetical protein DFH09DRAFT_1375486 [Mycena vulgaris]|nr:hypothetical protein DFH09DRAFT_1375486 [Mycena vulgaris]
MRRGLPRPSSAKSRPLPPRIRRMDASFTLRPFGDDLAIRLLMESPSSASLRRVLQGEELFYFPPPHRTRTLPPIPPLPHTGRRTHPATNRLLFLDSNIMKTPTRWTHADSLVLIQECIPPLRPQHVHLDLLPSPPVARRLPWHDTCPSHRATPIISGRRLAIARLHPLRPPHPIPLRVYIRIRSATKGSAIRSGGGVAKRARRVEAEECGWGAEAVTLVHRLRLRL